LKAISTDIKERISTIGHLFVAIEGLVDLSIIAVVDSALLHDSLFQIHLANINQQIL
jgi:hypothetical protein